jgi:hypothetical protein
LAGCASIRDLSPEKAAARISSSDSYKQEACEIMTAYVTRFEAFNWEAATALEPLQAGEISHIAAVFAARPEVSCRIKAGKFFYDIDGRSFADIARVLGPLQDIYAGLSPGEPLTQCVGCELPSVSNTNGYLVAYFRRPPFPALRKEHAEEFTRVCTDPEHFEDNAALITAHDGHAAKPGTFNPLYESHGGCGSLWRKALADMQGRCSRFGYTHYLICPTGVWDTHADPGRPLSGFGGFTQTYSFAAGFALALDDGRIDIYWLTAPDTLTHEAVALDADAKVEIDDYDANGKSDFNAGDVIVLAEKSGFGRRTTVQEFNANVAAKDFAQKYARNIDTWNKLPLDAVEALLVSTDFKNPVLIGRAAELSSAWFDQARGEQRALVDQVQTYWHALLWNTLAPKAAVDRAFWSGLLAKTAPEGYTERQNALSELRKRGDAKALYDGCAALRDDMKSVVEGLSAAVSGAQAADGEIGAAWERYLRKRIPVSDAQSALALARKNGEALNLFLNGVCF